MSLVWTKLKRNRAVIFWITGFVFSNNGVAFPGYTGLNFRTTGFTFTMRRVWVSGQQGLRFRCAGFGFPDNRVYVFDAPGSDFPDTPGLQPGATNTGTPDGVLFAEAQCENSELEKQVRGDPVCK